MMRNNCDGNALRHAPFTLCCGALHVFSFEELCFSRMCGVRLWMILVQRTVRFTLVICMILVIVHIEISCESQF